MARQSYNSRAQQLQRQADPFANGAWLTAAVAAVESLPAGTTIRLGDDFAVEHGLDESKLRKLGSGTGGRNMLTMDATFDDVAPTGINPSGKRFAGYVWTVR